MTPHVLRERLAGSLSYDLMDTQTWICTVGLPSGHRELLCGLEAPPGDLEWIPLSVPRVARWALRDRSHVLQFYSVIQLIHRS